MHIGHARVYTFFDTFRRFLEYLGLKVILVLNFTDIDDKIINKARELYGFNIVNCWYEVPKKYINEFFEICNKLYIKSATYYPKVSEHIQDMINWISKLIEKGYAYVTDDGSVYFEVSKISGYGSFSGQDINQLIAGARVEPEPGKKNPLDFALWKSWKEGEPWWNSPWSPGRPGWHLECVVMSTKYLGIPFDFHGGGLDLIFPHHENEIAIAKAMFGIENFANYWIHVGLVTIKGEKMSKSLGNIIPVEDVLKKYDGEVLRLYYASTHYRKPLDFSFEGLEQAKITLRSLYVAYDYAIQLLKEAKDDISELDQEVFNKVQEFENNFVNAIFNDLDTPTALAILITFSKYITSKLIYNPEKVSKYAISTLIQTYVKLANILGILNKVDLSTTIINLIELVLEVRNKLRSMKMYELADYIRNELNKLGIIVSDTRKRTYWSIER